MIVNKLHWVSNTKAAPGQLEELNSRMSEFYATFDQRKDYQTLIDDMQTEGGPNNLLAEELAKYIISQGFKNVLEVGCGSGKVYGHLLAQGFKGSYSGVEMAQYVIEQNKKKHPGARWETGSVYGLEDKEAQYDCVFSVYVLEHLIYPQRALAAMIRVVKPGGQLVVLFPDFVSSGIVPSQKVGLTYGVGAKEKLKKGKWLDAVISYWEGFLMRQKLKRLNDEFGEFVINYKPYCLEPECRGMIPDFDAIYLGNKVEVEKWARALGYGVQYPLGTEGLLSINAFMAITK